MRAKTNKQTQRSVTDIVSQHGPHIEGYKFRYSSCEISADDCSDVKTREATRTNLRAVAKSQGMNDTMQSHGYPKLVGNTYKSHRLGCLMHTLVYIYLEK